MTEPEIAGKKPILVQLKAGRPVLWCSCGRSKKQPYCDGSHKGSDFRPVKYVPAQDEEVLLCACKRTKSQPICDGSHNNLGGDYAVSETEAEPEVTISNWEERFPGFSAAALDNGCYVARVGQEAFEHYDQLGLAPVIIKSTGAKHLSYYSGLLWPGASSVLRFNGADVALFAVDGDIEISIGGHSFPANAESGVAIKPDEAFQLINSGDGPVRIEFAVCPEAEAIEVLSEMPVQFDASAPNRVIGVDPEKREAMADRFYQVLVDKKLAGSAVTQFIGEIPKSRAKHHRHLYEEAILVIRGEGFMWTDETKTPVKAGDVIFLPKKQHHSLECTSDGGMRLMGVFFPSGSPAVNY
ncbi:MAG: CDGSH iron-sulfur domain-containing protein [Sphingomonadales bacterium]